MAAAATLLALLAGDAMAGSEKNYIWRGWRMSEADYAIVHARPVDPTDNDFYLVCRGGRGRVEIAIRSWQRDGYGLETEADIPTVFLFGSKRIPAKAAFRGPSEMLGGIAIHYAFERDDPVLAAVVRGEPFRVLLPRVTTQRFAPAEARRFFAEMAAHCKGGT